MRSTPDRVAFFERVVTGVKALPGVPDAAYVSTPPFTSIGNTSGFRSKEATPRIRQDVLVRIGTVDYLANDRRAARRRQRLLDSRDQENAPRVVVINETFAKLHWPGRSAVGRRISLGDDRMRTIVGVVRDIRERGYEPEAKPAVYLPNTQVTGTFFLPEVLVVRASGDLTSLVAPIRAAVANVDPEQPISAIRTMEDVLDLSIVDRKRQTTLLGVFASIAVLLGGARPVCGARVWRRAAETRDCRAHGRRCHGRLGDARHRMQWAEARADWPRNGPGGVVGVVAHD